MKRALLLALVLAGCRKRDVVRPDPVDAAPEVVPQHGNHVWSKVFSGGDDRLARDLAIDGAGNAVVVGRFSGQPDFGNGPLVSNGSSDAFAMMLSPSGSLRWAIARGGFHFDEAHAVAALPDGHFVFGGQLHESPFVTEVDGEGKSVWFETLSGKGEIRGLAIGNGGMIVAVGRSLLSGACKFTPADGSDIVALSKTGDVIWSVCSESRDLGRLQRVAIAPTGDAYVCGTYRGRIDFGTAALVEMGAPLRDQIFYAKLNGKGGLEWLRGTSSQGGSCRALVAAGDGVFIGGECAGAITFGDVTLPDVNVPHGFVASVSSDGRLRFATGEKELSGSISGLAPSGDGVVAAGVRGSTHLLAYGAKGERLWRRDFEGGSPIGLARTRDGSLVLAGEVFVTGDLDPILDLGGGRLAIAPARKGESRFDVWVARLGP